MVTDLQLTIRCDTGLETAAQSWSEQLHCPFDNQKAPWCLHLSHQGWSLFSTESDSPPITLDFLKGSLGYRLSPKRTAQEPLLKTLGKLKKTPCQILDASAGFGVDAMILASQGHHITACERHMAPYTLLFHALKAAANHPELGLSVKNIDLHYSEATSVLTQHPIGFFDIIYFDPMYPLEKRKARPNQKMHLNKQVVGSDADADNQLAAFLKHNPKKVIVKRPKKAPYLNHQKPHQSLFFQSTRYDIYLPNPISPI